MDIYYGYKKNNIEFLSSINLNSNNFYNYKGLNFLSKIHNNHNNLIIIFHGSVPTQVDNNIGIDRIIFRGYNYDIDNTDTICICDYLLNIYNDYLVNWTLSTVNHNVENIYIDLFTYIINHKKYNKIIFTGTSAGGFPSIKYASYFKETALISNSQLYLENYKLNKGFYQLKNIVEKCGDKLLYNDKDIEKYVLNSNPKEIIYFINSRDWTYTQDFIHFYKFIIKNNLRKRLSLYEFKYNGKIPKGKDQHHIQFPNNESYLNILSKYILN